MLVSFNVTNVLDVYVFNGLTQTADIGMASVAGLYQSVVGLILVTYQTCLQDESIQTQLCSRKEENMAERKLKRKSR